MQRSAAIFSRIVAISGTRQEREYISDRHKFWELGGAVQAAATKVEAAANAEPETIAKGDGVEIVADRAADWVRIVFAAKPSVEMIGKLNGEAWKWASSAGAWQRKLTDAAKASAKRLTQLG